MDGDGAQHGPTLLAQPIMPPAPPAPRAARLRAAPGSFGDGRPEGSQTVASRLRNSTAQVKVAALRRLLEHDLVSADIKWSLFVAAAQSYRFDSCLHPFPPYFMKNETKDIDGLRNVLACMPSFPTLLLMLSDVSACSTRRPMIDLLHWVLIELEEPKLQCVPKSEHAKVLAMAPEGLKCTPPNFIFRLVSSPEATAERRWHELSQKHSTIFAFHGSRLENFYSILNFGLLKTLYRKSLYGHGVYLASELLLSLSYSPMGFGWGGSVVGSEMSCIALCEVIDNKDIKYQVVEPESGNQRTIAADSLESDIPNKHILAQNSDLIRVRYLYVYAKNPNIMSKTGKGSIMGWLSRHKLLTLMVGYILLLGSVGMSGNPTVQRYYRMLLRRWGL